MAKNSIQSIKQLLVKISKIEKYDKAKQLFNSNKPYVKNEAISLEDLSLFEEKYEIELPIDYKIFLNLAGNGFFNVLALKEIPDENYKLKNNFKNLKVPFPYQTAWDFYSYNEFKVQYKLSNKFVLSFLNLSKFKEDYISLNQAQIQYQTTLFGENTLLEDEHFLHTLYNRIYHSDEHISGCIQLSNYGCAIRGLLVINGTQKGKVWIDDRANGNGLYPEVDDKGQNLDFYTWLNKWVEEILLEFEYGHTTGK